MDDSSRSVPAAATALAVSSAAPVAEELTSVALRNSLTSSVECAICTNPFHIPSTIACGHTFCIHCLRMHLRRRPMCPICRSPCHADPQPNVALCDVMRALYPTDPSAALAEGAPSPVERVRMLPVFLSTSVAFPMGVSQLHLFEPRYRELARRAREATGEFVIVYTADGSGFPLRVAPESLVGSIACIMSIEQSRETHDGRWLLVCRGSGRAVVREAWDEEDAAALTVAKLTPIEEAEADTAPFAPGAEETPLRVAEWENFESCFDTVLGEAAAKEQRQAARAVLQSAGGERGPDVPVPQCALPALRKLSWVAAMHVPHATPPLHQALLAADSTHARLRALAMTYGGEARRLRARRAWRAKVAARLLWPSVALSPLVVVLLATIAYQVPAGQHMLGPAPPAPAVAPLEPDTLATSIGRVARLLMSVGGEVAEAPAAPAPVPVSGLASVFGGLFGLV